MKLQQGISLANHQALVGSELDVLVERVTGTTAVGRSYRDAPEVDGSVVMDGVAAAPGDIVRARITGAQPYDLIGVPAPGAG
jgi:ribosomal protein S12 methylthiotransferase